MEAESGSLCMETHLMGSNSTQTLGRKTNLLFISFSLVVLGSIFSAVIGQPVEDKHALLDFLHGIHHVHSFDWHENTLVCQNWTGVTCDSNQSRVIVLHVPGKGIQGPIPPDTLSRLTALQILSLRSNEISGVFPSDFSRLENLRALYLEKNKFSGPLPLNFSAWKNLSAIDLSNNNFNGSIPSSISSLTGLKSLNLANNSLSGQIPDVDLPGLQGLDLSNNRLTGTVPKSLQRFPSRAFSGNNLSSAFALPPALPLQPPSPQPTRKAEKLGKSVILGIAIGGSVLILAVVGILIVVYRSKKSGDDNDSAKAQNKGSPSGKDVSEGGDRNKLVFFEGSNLAFDLEDLLRASAEVLGKGTFGVTYKAALEDATTVVVKRLKEGSANKRDFGHQMLIVGNIRHKNVVPLRAYYHSNDEKLVVYDFYEQGSVSAMLHGKRGEDRIPLDWEARLKIVIGTARGIAHIHTQNGGKLVHGNIKASNMFLNSDGYGCVSDIGLTTIMDSVPPLAHRLAGYRAPEVTDTRKASQASDVYSFGVFLLETLTGRAPIPAAANEEFVHLVRWVNSVVREEWTAEVFDVELLRYPNIEEEMVEMLQIGLTCTARVPEQRPKMADVVKMVEGVRQEGNGNRPSPIEKSEASTSTTTRQGADKVKSNLETQRASSSSIIK